RAKTDAHSRDSTEQCPFERADEERGVLGVPARFVGEPRRLFREDHAAEAYQPRSKARSHSSDVPHETFAHEEISVPVRMIVDGRQCDSSTQNWRTSQVPPHVLPQIHATTESRSRTTKASNSPPAMPVVVELNS